MAAMIGKYAANKLLQKQVAKYKHKRVDGDIDPLFALIEDPKRPGKTKKVARKIPAYIPAKDAEVLAKVRKHAYRLDCGLFTLFGIRFGWESVIGLIPAVGDALGAVLALLLVRKCMGITGGLEATIILQMLLNIAFDFLVGLVPFVGDLADAAWKCNAKNCRLLEKTLDQRYKPEGLDRDDGRDDSEARRKRRKSGIYHRNDPPAATAFGDISDDERSRSRSRGPAIRDQGPAAERVRAPQPARAQEERRGGERGGRWWGRSREARAPSEVDMEERPTRGERRQETGSVVR